MWRYHKELKLWLTKDAAFEPVRVSASEERGYYIFFDTASWQRQRVRYRFCSYECLMCPAKHISSVNWYCGMKTLREGSCQYPAPARKALRGLSGHCSDVSTLMGFCPWYCFKPTRSGTLPSQSKMSRSASSSSSCIPRWNALVLQCPKTCVSYLVLAQTRRISVVINFSIL